MKLVIVQTNGVINEFDLTKIESISFADFGNVLPDILEDVEQIANMKVEEIAEVKEQPIAEPIPVPIEEKVEVPTPTQEPIPEPISVVVPESEPIPEKTEEPADIPTSIVEDATPVAKKEEVPIRVYAQKSAINAVIYKVDEHKAIKVTVENVPTEEIPIEESASFNEV